MSTTWDMLSAIIGGCSSLALFILVWWKVSKGIAANQAVLETHEEDIRLLKLAKSELKTTEKNSDMIDELNKVMLDHHTNFRIHRNEDSEKRITDLIDTVRNLAKENRDDHQVIMSKLTTMDK